MSSRDEEMCRLSLEGDDGTETVWARPVGGGRFSLESVPFFAYNVSLGDVVEASGDVDDLVAGNVVTKSGHRTLRAVFEEGKGIEGKKAGGLIAELERIGCGVEGLPPMLLAIDVPAEVDIERAIELCDAAEVEWEYGDPQPDD